MPKLVFDKCCGFVDLKKGCFIIGYLNLVAIFLLVVLNILIMIPMIGTVMDVHSPLHSAAVGTLVMVCLTIAVLFLAVGFDVMLLMGLYKDIPSYLKAYVIYSLVFFLITSIQFIVSLGTSMQTVVSIIVNILSLIICVYFILVIRSMYYRMLETNAGNNAGWNPIPTKDPVREAV